MVPHRVLFAEAALSLAERWRHATLADVRPLRLDRENDQGCVLDAAEYARGDQRSLRQQQVRAQLIERRFRVLSSAEIPFNGTVLVACRNDTWLLSL